MKSCLGRLGIFVVWVAAVAFFAGCSNEPDRTDIRITALESNINHMAREMEGLRVQLTQNEANILKLSNPSNKPALPPTGHPAVANGSASDLQAPH